MFRKTVFWLHLSAGVTAGVFILIMAATGVLLAFERQITDFVDRNTEYVSVPQDPQPASLNDLLDTVRRAHLRQPTAIVVRNHPQTAYSFHLAGAKPSTSILTAAPFSE
ncbi:MAG: PepSY-associated TM helix domain-containing protein [Bryobacteraceae bacterium]